MERKILHIDKLLELSKDKEVFNDEMDAEVIKLIDNLSYDIVISPDDIRNIKLDTICTAMNVISAYLALAEDVNIDNEQREIIKRYDLSSYASSGRLINILKRSNKLKRLSINKQDLF